MALLAGREEHVVIWIFGNRRISGQEFFEGVADAGIEDDHIPLVAFFFADFKMSSQVAIVIQKIPDLELEEIGDAEGGVDSGDEEQEVTVTLRAFELILNLGNFF